MSIGCLMAVLIEVSDDIVCAAFSRYIPHDCIIYYIVPYVLCLLAGVFAQYFEMCLDSTTMDVPY